MALTTAEFYEKFKDYLSLPDNCVSFTIVGEPGEWLIINCVIHTGETKDDHIVSRHVKYKLVELDD